MSGPVERWLETFMCKQYADLFEAYGFKTLQSVCQLQPSTLHSMGIPPEHCDKILENVSVLRQSLVGSIGANYSDHGYDHQMASHGQNNSSYSYHTPSNYQSHTSHQYGSPNGPMNHNLPYPAGENYSSGQANHYGTSNQDVYGQSMYNNHLHPNHGSWEDPMRLYNHSPRHVMGSSPPPPSSMMRSPPPPPAVASPPGMSIPTHYSRHVLGMEQPPPSSHHHSWPQTQVMSPAMVNSPRGTPSPGMAHPSSIASPVLSNCSPAHGKPFSPPPYSPHPPPAHQQSVGYDYPPSQNPSPSLTAAPNRHLGSSSVTNTPSDPLQRLQKMVMIDQPSTKSGVTQQIVPENLGSCPGSKAGSKFSSVEQLAGHGTPSPCPSYASQKSKSTDSLSPPTTSGDSTGKSSVIDASPASDADFTEKNPQPALPLPSSGVTIKKFAAVALDQAPGFAVVDQHWLTNAAFKEDSRRPHLINSSNEGYKSCDEFTDVSDSLDECDKTSRVMSVESSKSTVKENWQQNQENGHTYSEDASLAAEDLSPVKQDVKADTVKVPSDPLTSSSPTPTYSISKTCDRLNSLPDAATDAVPERKSKRTPCSKKRHRKKRRTHEHSRLGSVRDAESCGSGKSSKLSVQKLESWNLEASSEMKFVAKKVGAEKSVKTGVSSSGQCDKVCSVERPRRVRAPVITDDRERSPSDSKVEVRTSPRCAARRSERLQSLDSNGVACKLLLKCDSDLPPAPTPSPPPGSKLASKSEVQANRYSTKTFKVVNGVVTSADVDVADCVVKIVKDKTVPENPVMESCTDSPSVDGQHTGDAVSVSSSPELSASRRRGRPIGSKNKPRSARAEKEPKVAKRKQRSEEKGESQQSTSKRSRQVLSSVDNVVKRSVVDGRYRGPYLHLDLVGGRLQNVTVVNAPPKDEEADTKGGKKRGSRVDDGSFLKKKMMAVGFHSTLSANYDVFTKDKTWVCSLCRKGSHYKGLGDLFGPFFEELSNSALLPKESSGPKPTEERVDGSDAQTISGRRVREKRKRSELVEEFFKSTMAKKGKRARGDPKLVNLNGPPANASSSIANIKSLCNRSSRSSHSLMTTDGELWVHEDCIVWCHGVYLMGQKILGLRDAIDSAIGMICSKCSEAGAMIGCHHKGCNEQYHYICAIEKGCKLDEEHFSVFCAKHKREPPVKT